MLICVEGMDGVGKSTIVNKLATELDFKIAEKPIKELMMFDKEQSKKVANNIYTNYSMNLQSMYYLLGFLSVLEDSKKCNIIMDRGFLSTFYFSYRQDTAKLFDSFADIYGTADLSIILYASVETRINRIKNRNNNDSDLTRKRLYANGYDKFFLALKKYNMPYIVINTEYLNVQEVIEVIKSVVMLWMKNNALHQVILDYFSIEKLQNFKNFEEIKELLEKIKNDIQVRKRVIQNETNNN